MLNTRVLLATLAGGVATFLIGWLIYGILLMDTIKRINPQVEGYEKMPPELWAIALSNLLWALLYALIFSRWAGISTFKSGMIAGAWMSGLLACSINLYFVAATNVMSFNGLLLDVVINIVIGGLMGGVIGWTLGYKQER